MEIHLEENYVLKSSSLRIPMSKTLDSPEESKDSRKEQLLMPGIPTLEDASGEREEIFK